MRNACTWRLESRRRGRGEGGTSIHHDIAATPKSRSEKMDLDCYPNGARDGMITSEMTPPGMTTPIEEVICHWQHATFGHRLQRSADWGQT